MKELRASLFLRERDPDPLANDPETPVISKLRLKATLSSARIYEILVTGFEPPAAHIGGRDPRDAERILQASTQRPQHTYGSFLAARGVSQDVLQTNLVRERLATTSIY